MSSSFPTGEHNVTLQVQDNTSAWSEITDESTKVLNVAGRDKLLYGSDYPHNVGDMEGFLSRVEALPSNVQDAVKGGNAIRLFRL